MTSGFSRSLGRGIAVPALLLSVACIDEQPTTPAAPAPEASLARAGSTTAGDPAIVSNGVPYRNPSYKHATGRSGGAELNARALLGRDGSTVLEVTTGALDGGDAPPHDMTRLQVKLLESADAEEATATLNYNDLSAGRAEYSYSGMARHHYLQVQGNVVVPNASGKRSRTGVVTLRERINLRPDLAASQLGLPAQALVNTVVDVAARIDELNGDVGATASCVMYVDGAEADRANGIWVAEGDGVDCLFSRVFDTPGQYSVAVAVEDVVPGDWDTANNGVAGSIEILDPETPLHGWARAQEYHETYAEQRRGSSSYHPRWASYGREYEWDYTRSRAVHLQTTDFRGVAPGSLSFPVQVEIERSSDGNVVSRTSHPSLPARWSNSYQTCAYQVTNLPGQAYEVLRVCSQHGAGRVDVANHRRTGTVAYMGSGYYRWRYTSGGGWNYYSLVPSAIDSGPREAWGADHAWNVRVTDGTETFAARPSVRLQDFRAVGSQPRTCSSWSNYYGSGSQCHQWDRTTWGVRGFGTF